MSDERRAAPSSSRAPAGGGRIATGGEHILDERRAAPSSARAPAGGGRVATGGEHISATALPTAALLQVQNLTKHFPVRKGVFSRVSGQVHAVDDISFSIAEGETLGLVGESGCGKSTTGKTILRLIEPTAGAVLWRGQRIDRLGGRAMRPLRRELQAVFQDPYSSLNPRMRAADIVAEPIRNFETQSPAQIRDRVASLFEKVGLRTDQMVKYPYEFSGGQRQRLGIARALAPKPRLIVCDEPVSALDVSVQAQVINLLMDLQNELGISYLFVAHDLAVVEHISHRVAVMYLGKIVELTDKRSLFASPQHPYTEALLAAVPVPDPKIQRARVILAGDVPSPIHPPSGCRFHTRCPYAFERCRIEEPLMKQVRPAHWAACHLREAAPMPLAADATGLGGLDRASGYGSRSRQNAA